ncbi:MAG: hypothetical protein ACXWRE_02015 [Pseudobdellovibrionaceae bacterium]
MKILFTIAIALLATGFEPAMAGNLILQSSDRNSQILRIDGFIDEQLLESFRNYDAIPGFSPNKKTTLRLDNAGGEVAVAYDLVDEVLSMAAQMNKSTNSKLSLKVQYYCISACISLFVNLSKKVRSLDLENNIEVRVSQEATFGFHETTRGADSYGSDTTACLEKMAENGVNRNWILQKIKEGVFTQKKLTLISALDLVKQNSGVVLKEELEK